MPEAQYQRAQSRIVRPRPPGASVVRAFEDRAAERPLAVAVRFEDWMRTDAARAGGLSSGPTLTYADLNRLANALAHRLIDLGVTPGTPVAICLDPSPLTAIAILGVLKAGGAYVPVSSFDPVERIAFVLHDTGAPVLLTQERLLPDLRRLAPHPIALDDPDGALTSGSRPADSLDPAPGNPDRPFDSRQTAYILYTSGSSGNPKGVMVPHESLAYYLRWHLEHLRPAVGHLDLPLSSSTCFAAGVTQFYTPLILGRTLHIFPHGAVRDPGQVFAWYQAHPDHGLYCVPTLWNELVKVAERQRVQGQPVVGPRGVLLSGEAVDQKLIDRSVDVWPALTLWNLYGPTEATANATAGELRPGLPPAASVTIGTAIAGTRVYLVDEAMREVAHGEIGELCICGPGVASGYVNLPELTAQRFLANPFDPADPNRLFKTGDLARATDDGSLLFLGRRDFQVKIRGYRIECAEIEHALLQHPAIRQAVVVCREQALVAYLTFHFARYISVDEVRGFLASRVPEYMMPAAFVMLDALPMLANGKADRKRLPAPGAQRPALAYPFEPPRTTRERQLVRVWEAALGVEGVGVQDNFFDLGGDSLKVAAAIARIREALHAPVSYRDLFDHPTPAALAGQLRAPHAADSDAADGLGVQPASTTISPDALVPDVTHLEALPARAAYPCADNQHSLWMLGQTWRDLSAYNLRFSVHFDGDLDRDALTQSLGAIVRRHDALRTTFRLDGDGPVARVLAFTDFADGALPTVDLRHLDQSAREAELERQTAADSSRPFRLDTGPLFRCVLYRLADDVHRLSIIVHHIVFDGRSIGIFCRELIDGYRRARREAVQGTTTIVPPTPTPPPVLPLQYQDWVVWQRRHVRAHGAALTSFWTQELDGSSFTLGFPADYARPARRSFHGAVTKVRLGETAKQRLTSFNQRERTTTFMTLLALFNLLLYRYSDQEDILVGCPVANRQHPELESLLGYFTNTIVIRTRLAKDRTFRALLASVRDACVRAFDRQSLPFEQVVQALRPDRRLSHTPVFQAMFAYHEKLFQGRVDDHLTAEGYEEGNRGAKFDLALDVQELHDGLELKLTYSTDLFADATAERCLDHYVRLLDAILDDPVQELASYSLMSPADLDRIAHWSHGPADPSIDAPATLYGLFEEQAARTPSHTALVAGSERLTYGSLVDRANRLAAHLIARGVEPGARVGVHVEPSADMIVALLAVLKTGAAYVPLDPYYPRDRLAYIIEDCGACAIVTQRHLHALVADCPSSVQIVDADGPIPSSGSMPSTDAIAATSAARDNGSQTPDPSLMYVMYTSGSTGRPKGVMVPHRGATNYVRWMQAAFPLTADDKVLGKTSINFDISVWEIFLPLVSGATLVVAGRDELQAPDSLAALIQRERITRIQFVPSALRAFVDSGRLADCPSLAHIFSGGEALPARLQADVFAASGAELHNLYGPTEASIYACHWACRRDERLRSVPIGRPIANLRAHILDAHRRAVPIGLPGELYLGGAGIARGYWNRPDLTEAAFVPDPWSDEPGARLFKTGDVARYWSDGALEFLGRSDRQVKVRGYRIELDEIEHHLSSHPQVKHAIIIVREDEADDVRLVAYMLYRDKHGPSATELREYLKQKLPDYMVPSTFVTLDSVPLLPNDKANVRALPKPSYTKSLDADLMRRYDTDCERQLATIWEDVLGTEKFGPEDNFFDVGGHSLLMSKLGLLIEQRLQIAITNLDLFQFPTIRSLARHVTESRRPTAPAHALANRRIAADMARRAALARRRTKPAGAIDGVGPDRVM